LVVSKLTSEEIGDLRRQLPAISEMCKRISTYGVPSTLVHGDLHMGNVASSNGRMVGIELMVSQLLENPCH
uniref:hypothetical protein n=1 Tax=Lysinibacillus sp. GbtcB16 TaxID=2824761 RepID=UPI001C30EFD7